MNNNILFLGFAVPDDVFTAISADDRYPQFAAQRLQWNIINGIEGFTGRTVRLMSAIPASNFPGFRKLIFRHRRWSHKQNSEDMFIPFVNLLIVKHITRFLSSLYYLVGALKQREVPPPEQSLILIYALHSPFLIASCVARRLFGVKIAVVIPDMPEYMDLRKRRNIVRTVGKAVDARLLRFLLKKMDGVIVLSPHMSDDLFGDGIPTMVMEGAVSLERIREAEAMESTLPADDREQKVVMYSGALTGIELLLASFARIQHADYRLWITGRGEMEPDIRRAAAKDGRIVYWGVVSDSELMRLQLQASVLVNVRSARTPFIRYSFPSKLLEYMAVGRPVLTTALPGIPGEYHDHLILLREETPEALAELLTEHCSRPRESLIAFGKRAQEFVRENKNQFRQGARICRFLASL